MSAASPNKTFEGLAAGWIASILVSVVVLGHISPWGEIVAEGGQHVNKGDLILLVGVTFWAAYTIFLRLKPPEIPGLPLLAACAVVGVFLLLPFLAYEMVYMNGRVEWTPATVDGLDGTLQVVGEGWWHERLVEHAERLGVTRSVDLLGFVPEPVKHERRASKVFAPHQVSITTGAGPAPSTPRSRAHRATSPRRRCTRAPPAKSAPGPPTGPTTVPPAR